jgi:hypothetical protein
MAPISIDGPLSEFVDADARVEHIATDSALPKGERPTNRAWGEVDWQTLHVTVHTPICQVKLNVCGQKLNQG